MAYAICEYPWTFYDDATTAPMSTHGIKPYVATKSTRMNHSVGQNLKRIKFKYMYFQKYRNFYFYEIIALFVRKTALYQLAGA